MTEMDRLIERDECESCHGFGYYLVEDDDDAKVLCRACGGSGICTRTTQEQSDG